mgnify:CR=1 FL=1
MKKLLFVLAFTFIGQQAFSQLYIVVATDNNCSVPGPGGGTGYELDIITPSGVKTQKCIEESYAQLNIELNNIISQGYKLFHIQDATELSSVLSNSSIPNINEAVKKEDYPFYTKYYFAVP